MQDFSSSILYIFYNNALNNGFDIVSLDIFYILYWVGRVQGISSKQFCHGLDSPVIPPISCCIDMLYKGCIKYIYYCVYFIAYVYSTEGHTHQYRSDSQKHLLNNRRIFVSKRIFNIYCSCFITFLLRCVIGLF